MSAQGSSRRSGAQGGCWRVSRLMWVALIVALASLPALAVGGTAGADTSTGTVTGTATMLDGRPFYQGPYIVACPADVVPFNWSCAGRQYVQAADLAHGGAYTLSLAPGSWNVAAIDAGFYSSAPPVLVTLSAGQTVTVNFRLRPPGASATMTGTVTGLGGTLFQNAGIYMCPADEPFVPPTGLPGGPGSGPGCPGGVWAEAYQANGGAYMVALVPGSYNVAGFGSNSPPQITLTDPILVTVAQDETITRNFVVLLPGQVPTSKDQCKGGGWQHLGDNQGQLFKNQGDCVSFVATGGKNPAAG
jgi:hypothetical protein